MTQTYGVISPMTERNNFMLQAYHNHTDAWLAPSPLVRSGAGP